LPDNEAVICFANHPAWWDPLVALLLHRLYLTGRTAYAPIDQTSLDQYPIFRKLGFYGIDLDSLEGAKRFLSVTRALLRRPTTAIWMTPGGKFADARDKTTFQPGLGHLAATTPGFTLVPLVLEYTFWEERTPEALIEFGQPIGTGARRGSKDGWQRELEDRLASAQASLAAKVISREPTAFDVVLDGSAGVGGWYDLGRRAKSLLMRTNFDPRHSRNSTRNPADD
jgi:1-acyl-sn-glycerol-3-phosphate acyltransferase